MKVALIGYGKMGREIESIAIARGHEVILKIDISNYDQLTSENLNKVDVVIEFTMPDTAVDNYKKCFDSAVPVVSGTTGWLDKWDEVIGYCLNKNSAFFYSSNFSLGVNLFFELNKKLATMIKPFDQYNVEMTEVHHTQKLDSPSGTAITLAEDLISILDGKESWVNQETDKKNELAIHSIREGAIPGIHTIRYESTDDFIEITHSSKSRKGLALGAVIAAEFVVNKKGIFSMSDMLKF